MKTLDCYCDECGQTRKHLVYKNSETSERIIMGIITCGLSELAVETVYECVSCGSTSTK